MSNSSNSLTPLVSIVMPVRNEERYLCEALDSILRQTYGNFELIVVDDGSVDDTADILAEYAAKYPCIRVISHPRSTGISIALNRGVKAARGEFLARMDADDISHPDRIKKQIDYLQKNPEIVAVGCQCGLIDGHGAHTGLKTFPTSHAQIYSMMMQYNPVMHPTLVIRRSRLPRNITLYDGPDGAEDLLLVFRLFQYGEVHNMPDYFYQYRIHNHNSSLTRIKHIFSQTLIARYRGVFECHYRPSLRGIASTVLQSILVYSLPETITKSIYMMMRGMVAQVDPAPRIELSSAPVRSGLIKAKYSLNS